MSGDETPASLLLRDAKINLQVSDALAEHLPEAPFQHEVYFQAFYAVEKATKAVCDVCGIATVGSENWNDKIKTHNIKTLMRLMETNPKLDSQMEAMILEAADKVRFHPEQKYPDLWDRAIPCEFDAFTTESANQARAHAHQFVSEVETWVAARS